MVSGFEQGCHTELVEARLTVRAGIMRGVKLIPPKESFGPVPAWMKIRSDGLLYKNREGSVDLYFLPLKVCIRFHAPFSAHFRNRAVFDRLWRNFF
jgi:hypothetical protein